MVGMGLTGYSEHSGFQMVKLGYLKNFLEKGMGFEDFEVVD